ncbi:MAG: methionine aminopeptidase [Phycisphaerales bacterium]|nr:MAG: methionine aminopeptidase [Phycisphaerales bacterium]
MAPTIRRRGAQAPLTEAQAQLAAQAAACVVRTHEAISQFLRAGQTLAEIDRFVGQTLEKLGCKSCFKGYRAGRHPPFPAHACLSVNDTVVHGHPGSYLQPLREGDVLKVDIGVWRQGWIGDAAYTYCFGQPDETTRRLMDCGKQALRRGIQAMQPGEPLVRWAQAIQPYVEDQCGFHMVKGLGGHAIGRRLHAPPFIANTVPTVPALEWREANDPFTPGMLLAVEPMIAVGTGQIRQDGNAWPLRIADGSQSVHYEADVLITEDGPKDLTAGLTDLPDVVTR